MSRVMLGDKLYRRQQPRDFIILGLFFATVMCATGRVLGESKVGALATAGAPITVAAAWMHLRCRRQSGDQGGVGR